MASYTQLTMRRVSHRFGTALIAALSITVLGAALAFACSPQANIGITPDGALASDPATVSGSAWPSEPVQIRWGSASGPTIASVQGPSFSVPVTLPTVNPGVYYVVAVAQSGRIASTAVEVRPSPPSPAEAPAGNGSGSNGSGSSGSSDTPAAAASPEGAGAPAASTATPSTGPARSAAPSRRSEPTRSARTRENRSDSTSRGSRGAPSRSVAAGNGNGAASPAASSNPSVVTSPSGQQVFGGSAATATLERSGRPARSGASKSGAAKSQGANVKPSNQSLALGDLSRGFNSPSDALVPGINGSGGAAQAPGAGLTVGAILLSTGLMALFGGFLVAGVRRRRSLVNGGQKH